MPVSIERDLDVLERSLTALKVDYERFFTGELRTPPMAARRKVDELLRRVGNVEVERAAERFRLQALQGRYTAMSELWDRRLAAKEEGRGLFRVIRAAPAAAAVPPPEPPARRPKSVSSDGEGSTSVKAVGRGDMKSLFDRFCAARAAAGEDVSRLRYERFEDLVKKQAAEIRRATGAEASRVRGPDAGRESPARRPAAARAREREPMTISRLLRPAAALALALAARAAGARQRTSTRRSWIRRIPSTGRRSTSSRASRRRRTTRRSTTTSAVSSRATASGATPCASSRPPRSSTRRTGARPTTRASSR